MRNIRSTFRTAAIAASTLALITGLAVTTAAPANAATGTTVSHSVSAKKATAEKPRLRYTHVDIAAGGPMFQEFTLRLTGAWKGPVTVTAWTDAGYPQVFTNVRNGQTITVQVAPEGAGFGCSIGSFEAVDTSGQKFVAYFGAHYNT